MFRDRLADYSFPAAVLALVTIGIGIEGDDAVVELYVASDRPADAIVLGRARLNRYMGTGFVEIDEIKVRQLSDAEG